MPNLIVFLVSDALAVEEAIESIKLEISSIEAEYKDILCLIKNTDASVRIAKKDNDELIIKQLSMVCISTSFRIC